jgi:hypothetical protein
MGIQQIDEQVASRSARGEDDEPRGRPNTWPPEHGRDDTKRAKLAAGRQQGREHRRRAELEGLPESPRRDGRSRHATMITGASGVSECLRRASVACYRQA